MFSPIKTMPAFKQAIMSTYIYDIIIAVIFIVALIIVANMISWSGGKVETSGKTRRVWYWSLAFLTLIAAIVFNFFAFYKQIGVPTFKAEYVLHMALGGIAASIIYMVVLYVIIKTQKTKSKLASIFAK